ncbi:uncharacterized protein BDV17DRAFT_261617 [Aspergillus undulatus]|uniref:uncharacterized protein n=1 Tax=Aspergillus undulatus TaxID=1810928 RepID=UPI003CCCE9E0
MRADQRAARNLLKTLRHPSRKYASSTPGRFTELLCVLLYALSSSDRGPALEGNVYDIISFEVKRFRLLLLVYQHATTCVKVVLHAY